MERTHFEEFAAAIAGMLQHPIHGYLTDDWFLTDSQKRDRDNFRTWYFAGWSAYSIMEKFEHNGYFRRHDNDVAVLRLRKVQRKLSQLGQVSPEQIR